jgi:hypothetical protein
LGSENGGLIAARSHFGGVRVQRDRLRVGFILSRPLESDRIARTLQLGGASYAHSVKIAGERAAEQEKITERSHLPG